MRVRVTRWKFQRSNGIWSNLEDICPISGVRYCQNTESIYVITHLKIPVYVGEAGNGSRRIHRGLRYNESQSISYNWRDRFNGKSPILICFVFDEFPKKLKLTDKVNRKALEADLAYAIKERTGKWPKMLTSISPHGSITRTKLYQEAVQNMLEQLQIANIRNAPNKHMKPDANSPRC